MAKQYIFTKDIAGSNNGYEVVNYNKNQVIEQKDLSEYLFNAWLKAGVIKDLEVGEDIENFLNDEDGNAPLPEGTEIVDEGEVKDGTEDAEEGEGEGEEENTSEGEENSAEGQPDTAELTDEKIGELVYQAKEILEVPEGVTLADEDKEEALPLVRRFYNMGFNIEATIGTAIFLKEHGIRTRIRRKLSEGSEEILDSIRAGYVSYVINTRAILSGVHYEDGIAIRRTASQNNVTTLTSLDTVKVLLDVLEEVTIGISTIDGK